MSLSASFRDELLIEHVQQNKVIFDSSDPKHRDIFISIKSTIKSSTKTSPYVNSQIILLLLKFVRSLITFTTDDSYRGTNSLQGNWYG